MLFNTIYDLWMMVYLFISILGLTELLLDRKILKLSIEVAKEREKRNIHRGVESLKTRRYSAIITYKFPKYITSKTQLDYTKFMHILDHRGIPFYYKIILIMIGPCILFFILAVIIINLFRSELTFDELKQPISMRLRHINYLRAFINEIYEENRQKDLIVKNMLKIETHKFKEELI